MVNLISEIESLASLIKFKDKLATAACHSFKQQHQHTHLCLYEVTLCPDWSIFTTGSRDWTVIGWTPLTPEITWSSSTNDSPGLSWRLWRSCHSLRMQTGAWYDTNSQQLPQQSHFISETLGDICWYQTQRPIYFSYPLQKLKVFLWLIRSKIS